MKKSSFKIRAWMIYPLIAILGLSACQTTKPPLRTAAYWTCPKMTLDQATSLSQYDVLIVCIENQFNNYDVLKSLKKLNPQIKLIGYYNTPEMWTTTNPATPWQNRVISEIKNVRPSWLLKSDQGEQIVFWKGMWLLNMSACCPLIQRETYGEWIANKLSEEVFSNKIWDGHFVDNGGGNVYWINDWRDNPAQGQIDADADRQPDSQSYLDYQWRQGMKEYLEIIRKNLGKKFIIIASKGSLDFKGLVQGKFFENFPNDYLGDTLDNGWQQCLANARQLGPYTIFHVAKDNLEFGLASSLLLDNVLVAVGQDNPNFPQSFSIKLGPPKGASYKKMVAGQWVYYRDFKNGRVEVVPSQRSGKIILD